MTSSSDRGGSAPCRILPILAWTSSGPAPFIRQRAAQAAGRALEQATLHSGVTRHLCADTVEKLPQHR